jgi:hypothetical protein
MPQSSSDESANRLRNLTETLDNDNNRRDKASMMNILSQEFVRYIGKRRYSKSQNMECTLLNYMMKWINY